jgi:Tol biopolymer transport system component
MGPASPIAEAVRFGPAYPGKLGISRTGSVVYVGGAVRLRELVIAERGGAAAALPTAARYFTNPRFSPDGQRLAFHVPDFSGRTAQDVWTYDLRSNNVTRLTFDSASSDANWSHDGRRIAYLRHPVSGPSSLFSIATDGSGTPESLLVRPNAIGEATFSRDGRFLVFRERRMRATGRDIWVAPLDSVQAARPLLRTPFEERGIALSPDGLWLAYVSDETGSDEIYVRRLAEGSGYWRVSRTGGREPRWGAGGRELLYRVQDTIVAAAFTPGAEPRFAPPQAVLVGRYNTTPTGVGWDIAPDGRRFVLTRNQGETTNTSVNVVLNWFDHQRAAPPAGGP